jgi:hypothetical protein
LSVERKPGFSKDLFPKKGRSRNKLFAFSRKKGGAEQTICLFPKKGWRQNKLFTISRKKGGGKTNYLRFPEKRVEAKQTIYGFPKKGWRQNKLFTVSRKKGGGKTNYLRFPEKRVEAEIYDFCFLYFFSRRYMDCRLSNVQLFGNPYRIAFFSKKSSRSAAV